MPNINISDIKSFWGSLLFRPEIDPSIKTILPSETARFLEKVGLPSDPELSKYLPNLDFTTSQLKLIEDIGKKYVVIGYQGYDQAQISIEEQTGELYYIKQGNLNQNYRKLFINKNLETFLGMLIKFLQHRDATHALRTEVQAIETLPERREVITTTLRGKLDELENVYRAMDEKAISSSPSWWQDFLANIRFL